MNDLEARLKTLSPVRPPRPDWMRQDAKVPTKRRPILFGLAAATFLAILVWILRTPPLLPPVEGPLGPVAGKSEEPSHPVRRTDLRNLFGAWRNLPWNIDPEEEDAVRRCRGLASRANHTIDGVIQFSLKGVREELEDVLARRPKFFYAEHLLGLWFDLQDQRELARIWYQRALEHAPAILAQDFVRADGSPWAELPIQVLSIDCNRVKDHVRLPSVALLFTQLRTDARGRLLLPVYDSVYEIGSFAHSTEYSLDIERLPYFESPGRVGVLPTVRVRQR